MNTYVGFGDYVWQMDTEFFLYNGYIFASSPVLCPPPRNQSSQNLGLSMKFHRAFNPA